MGCNSSRNAEQPVAAEAAQAAAEVSANALPASQEIAVPDSAVAPAATVRDQTPSAAPPSPSLIEKKVCCDTRQMTSKCILCVCAEPSLMFLTVRSNRSE
jgi:hypothetical protein